ncbi:MAG: 50S ribosomal protein L11, partial [Ekhidna sp.]|nr:50S ribosomal protein L11 [Ekhidna sp.]
EPDRARVGWRSGYEVQAIAEKKLPDLNAFSIESAMKIVAGTAKSMGVKVSDNAS